MGPNTVEFYVYELVVYPDNKVCYVGKGHDDRLNDHLRLAFNRKTKHFDRWIYRSIREIISLGKTIKPRIVFRTFNEIAALTEEMRRIQEYGFDNLLNTASHAFAGRMLKPHAKKLIAEASRRMWKNPEYRRKNKTSSGCSRRGMRIEKNNKQRLTAAGTFGFKGVTLWSHLNKPPRWIVRIILNVHGGSNKIKFIGYVLSLLEGAFVYDNESERAFGTRPNKTNNPLSVVEIATIGAEKAVMVAAHSFRHKIHVRQ